VNPFYALITPVEQPSQPPGGQPPGTQPPVPTHPIYYPPEISGPPGPWPSPPIAGIPGLPGYNPPGGQPPGGGGQPPYYPPASGVGPQPVAEPAHRGHSRPAGLPTAIAAAGRRPASGHLGRGGRTSRSRRRRSRAFPACRATSLRGASGGGEPGPQPLPAVLASEIPQQPEAPDPDKGAWVLVGLGAGQVGWAWLDQSECEASTPDGESPEAP
jgi:hypothetical protein